MSVSVKLDTARLDKIITELPGAANETVRSGAFAVEGRAKALAPVDTGALKNSIHSEQETSLLWHVADAVEYGIYQELGTSRMRAQPFMIPAVEATRQQYLDSWRQLFARLR